MAEGIVSGYDTRTGWGVIIPDDGGPRLRVHQAEIRLRSHQALERGERVSFVVEQHDDGPYARAVTPLGPILTEEELDRIDPVPPPRPRPDPPPVPIDKVHVWLQAAMAIMGLAALPCLVVGVVQVANGNEEWLPVLIIGVVLLLILERIPHDEW